MKNFVAEEVAKLREQCRGKRVVLGVSGGVDSTTLAVLLQQGAGRKVTSIFVNNGLLRLNEENEVLDNLRRRLGLKVTYIDASAPFPEQPQGSRLPGTQAQDHRQDLHRRLLPRPARTSTSWSRAPSTPT